MIDIEKLLKIVSATELIDDMAQFDPAKTFKENNIDSLDVMTLLLAIEEGIKVKFSEDEVAKITTLNSVLSVISQRT